MMCDPGGGHPPPESQPSAQMELLLVGKSHDNLYAIADKGPFLFMLN